MAKRIISMLLAVCLCMGMGLQAFAVAKIGETEYESLAAAFKAANDDKTTEGSIEIQLTDNAEVGANINVNRDITLLGGLDEDGQFVVNRKDGYTGTLFTVNKDSTFTLDGDVVIDGGNDWTFDEEQYNEDLAANTPLADCQTTYTHSEEGGTVAKAPMINVANGDVVMKDATIQNNYSDNHTNGIFKVPAGSSVTLEDGAEIEHIRNSVFGTISGFVEMNGGKIKDVFAHDANGGVVYVSGKGEFQMDGGEITEIRSFGPNTNGNGNGVVAQVYGDSAKMTMNGGSINNTTAFCPGGGWGAAIYLNRDGDFTMTGGEIVDTNGNNSTTLAANRFSDINLEKGFLEISANTGKANESTLRGNVIIGEEMNIVSEKGATFLVNNTYNGLIGDVVINGNISGEGTMWLATKEPVTGTGTITSDVLIKKHSYYPAGQVILGEANWNCFILVDSVGSTASLTVKNGANVTDGYVRVLESVESGDYTNPEESATAQASAYTQENGANVTSPVRYYHRLLADQKDEVVVTFDYNGGVDAQGWSGCQLTGKIGENGFVPTSPLPEIEGMVLAGWKYAVVNDPETLDMNGDADYADEGISETIRLVAQWKEPEPDEPEDDDDDDEKTMVWVDYEDDDDVVVIDDESTPLSDAPSAPEEQYDVPSDTETIIDEDVPLADVPGLGDESAIWMLVAAFAIFGLVVINLPQRKREDN